MERTTRRNRSRRTASLKGRKHLRNASLRRRKPGVRGNGHPSRRTVAAAHAQNAAAKRRADPRYTAAVKSFEAATRYFLKEQYAKAREIFEKVVAEGPVEIAERARVHLRLCERQMSEVVAAPRGSTENYNLGIAALNARQLDQAIEYLRKADRSAPNREEVRYALAAAFALQGNANAALEHLKAAIELRPGNRFQARLDEDFQSLVDDRRFKELMHPEKPPANPSPYQSH
jgi:tetratricopeptide (TPR) repeat protein